MSIFERIKELADKRKISLQKVATDLGFGENYIYNLKGAKSPAADKLSLIADYFHVSVDYLLGRPEISTKKKVKNRIKELRLSKKLTSAQLTVLINDWLKSRHAWLSDLLKDKPKVEVEEFSISEKELLLYENNLLNIKEFGDDNQLIDALCEIFGVSIGYLLGYNEVDELEDVSNAGNIFYKKAFEETEQLFTDDSLSKWEALELSSKLDLYRAKGDLLNSLGQESFDKIRENYQFPDDNTYEENFETICKVLFDLNRQVLTVADYQIMLNFVQLTKQNQAKALEQVKNLLIVQKATEKNDQD
ncbi:helix-turn-helix domain-containing protein [Lactococcus garvieae]|uniref:helix-turn-helix domain-containing protein n=1 Tax=Lactococcus garvieae TaxID=1363 RepID=UPI00388FA5C8